MEQLSKLIGKSILVIVGAALVAVFMSIPVWWLWNNCLVGAVNSISEIGILQALGLNILFGLLFRSTNGNIVDGLKTSLKEE